MPGEPGATVVTNSCVLLFTHEAAGALATRHSPRPLLGEGYIDNSGVTRRGDAGFCLNFYRRPCESRDPHTPALIVARKSSDRVSSNRRRGVWVPAFAGTTVKWLFDRLIRSS